MSTEKLIINIRIKQIKAALEGSISEERKSRLSKELINIRLLHGMGLKVRHLRPLS